MSLIVCLRRSRRVIFGATGKVARTSYDRLTVQTASAGIRLQGPDDGMVPAAWRRLRPRRRADQLGSVRFIRRIAALEITHFYRQNAKFLHGSSRANCSPAGPHPERQRICLKAVRVATEQILMFFDIGDTGERELGAGGSVREAR